MGRNGVRFNNSVITLQAAKTKILTAIVTSAPGLKGYTSNATMEQQILQHFQLVPKLRKAPNIKLVVWKTPPILWYKANTDGSVVGDTAACGGLFRDHRADHVGSFAQNIGIGSVLHAEITAIIIALERAAVNGWQRIWIESDSLGALAAFANPSIVPWDIRNRWCNATSLGLTIVHTHIFREGNMCADKLANHGHSIAAPVWWDSVPSFVYASFLYDKLGLPCYRFD
jgi:ribonuclease HI